MIIEKATRGQWQRFFGADDAPQNDSSCLWQQRFFRRDTVLIPLAEPIVILQHQLHIQPTYPAQAVFAQLKGKAIVRAQVLANGQVGEAFIKQTSGAPMLDQAALSTVRPWRFRPARRNGEPVPAWVNVPIEYRYPS